MAQSASSTSKQLLVIDDRLWERLIDLTHGAAAACFQCGVCTAICPWGQVRQEPFSVRNLIRRTQIGAPDGYENLWLCTTCGQCQTLCPREVNVVDVLRGLRYLAWETRKTLEGQPAILWSVYWNDNPWSQPPSHRSEWAKELHLPEFDAQQHEILLYIGCTSSYDRRAQKIARSLVSVLRAAGISFGCLADDEPCCGESVLSLGHIPYFQEIVQHTSRIFQKKGVRQVVTVSPHCYDVFKNHYPRHNQDFQPLHYTQYLSQLIDAGRLEFERTFDTRITFQDPCYLGRHNDQYIAPRSILSHIPGAELVEMKHHGSDALCCGGGGGRMWLETPAGERFSDLRVEEARGTGASILATACPFCIVCLEDSVKSSEIENLKIMDIAEIASMALKST
jgi:Fe-S oxidoreductase